MRLSPFRICIALIVSGIIWMGFVSGNIHSISEEFSLGIEQTGEIDIGINGGLGFYVVSIPELGNSVFVQVLDPERNVISDKKIETKMVINYFEVGDSGIYTIRATNISDGVISAQLEVGQINTSEMTYPGIVIVAGVLMLIVIAYIKMRNYNTAQPDENIS